MLADQLSISPLFQTIDALLQSKIHEWAATVISVTDYYLFD